MKQLLVLICFLQFITSCSAQKDDRFELFLNNFMEVDYPVNPTEVINSLDRDWEHYIPEDEFDNYFRTSLYSTWEFNEKYQYVYGGKLEIDFNKVCVFYRRVYFAEDVNNQKSEIILCVFDSKDKLIAGLPIAGGYGDSITFSSVIQNPKKIIIKTKKYHFEEVEDSIEYFEIKDSGEISSLKE